MIDILHRFLLQNRSISIPGLGTLHAERIAARLSSNGSQIIPPGYSFRFDKYFDAPDKAFFVYLSGKQGIPEYESMRLYNQFAQDFRSAIMLEERAEWPGIGYFRKNVSGEVEFVQTRPAETSYAPADLISARPPVVVSSTGAEKEVKPDETILTDESIVVEPVATTRTAVDLVPVSEAVPVSTDISSVEPTSSDADGVGYAYPLEEESASATRTNRTIMRIGWGVAAAASLLMILHFSQHGFTMKAAANNQTFQPARP